KTIYSDNIIIATGSRPRKLENIPIDEKIILTSDGMDRLKNFPKSMVILGAGVIGCEFATIFSNFGKTKVYLIDKADRILPFEDEDIATMVNENLAKNGVVIHHDASVIRMEIKNGKVEYELAYKDGRSEVINVEKALISVGRIPNLEDLGLDQIGVEYKDGRTILDDDTSTSIDNIYAVGDVTAHIALVNVAELEGRRAVEKMFGKSDRKITYKNISTIMFLNPEVAAVGMGEQQVNEKGIPYRLVKLDYSCIARAIAMRKTKGFFKILVTDDEEMKILGMRAVGEHASSAIQGVALLISMNRGIIDLADLIHPHPSIIEGIQECLRMLLGKSIFKAEVFEDKLKCYRCVDGKKIPMENLNH
ncbi:MAG TPA: NAD(P)/FAD-dependent oxidoreductase, partial [Flavobacteriales bacterium]|nr:NAD(P)/FAD-dependent oxidoreductase [Flavobacteriales bacterium]